MRSPRMQSVAPGVTVWTSRRMQTTSTILDDGVRAFLVDPAWLPDELDELADHLQSRGLTVTGGFATHAHHDHLLWHPRFGDAPRWASPRTAALAHEERVALVGHLGDGFDPELVDLMGRVQAVPGTIPTSALPDGIDVELVVHDGHAPGHTALWLPRQRVLLAGDMLSDIELPLPFFPDDVAAYVRALDVLEPVAAEALVVVPGHGTVGRDGDGDGAGRNGAGARLAADRRYLDDVSRTGDSDDARRHHEGMAEMHARLQEITARSR